MTQKQYSDPKPPAALIELQQWMQNAVRAPHLSPQSQKNSDAYITSSNRQNASQRLNIYLNDYWPRCLDSLAEDFELLKAYWGEKSFDRWMEAYLLAYPSKNFTLFYLGKNLLTFLEAHYSLADKVLVLELARYDWALCLAYMQPESPRFDPQVLSEAQKQNVASLPLQLHPSVTVLAMGHGIRQWKNSSKKPFQKKKTYAIVYRLNGVVYDEPLEMGLFEVLNLFLQPTSLEACLERLENKLGPKHLVKAEEKMERWFKTAVEKGWFVRPSL